MYRVEVCLDHVIKQNLFEKYNCRLTTTFQQLIHRFLKFYENNIL